MTEPDGTSAYAAERCAPACEPLATPHARAETRRTSKQIGVRIDGDLYEALERDAKENGRTVTQSVRWLLRRALQLTVDGRT